MKTILIILILLPIMCWANLVFAGSIIVVERPGISLIQDEEGDLFLQDCVPGDLVSPCSLPPGVPATSPPWTDINMVKVQQVGREWVDFTITTYGDIPEDSPFWFTFAVVFDFSCLADRNDGFRVIYQWGYWSANWITITSCDPRVVIQGESIPSLTIRGNTVKVRVSIDDLYKTVPYGDPLPWLAIARRIGYATSEGYNTKTIDIVPGDPLSEDPEFGIFEPR